MPSDKSRNFVDFIIENVNGDNKGFRAKFAHADNPNTEYKCWDTLARWVNLEDEAERRAFALVAASVARVRAQANGTLGLGSALFSVMSERNSGDADRSSDSPRLRRILACRDRLELISVLRSTVKLIESRGVVLDYSRLLDEIQWFNSEKSRERTTARWTQEFYGRKGAEE